MDHSELHAELLRYELGRLLFFLVTALAIAVLAIATLLTGLTLENALLLALIAFVWFGSRAFRFHRKTRKLRAEDSLFHPME
jgi:hypothetical protein